MWWHGMVTVLGERRVRQRSAWEQPQIVHLFQCQFLPSHDDGDDEEGVQGHDQPHGGCRGGVSGSDLVEV